MLEYWPAAVVLGTGLVAWGEMRAKLSSLRRDVDVKASTDVVQAHYTALCAQLDRIEARLDRDAA